MHLQRLKGGTADDDLLVAYVKHRSVREPSHPNYHHAPVEQLLVQKDHVADVATNLTSNPCVYHLVLHLYAQLRHNKRRICFCLGIGQSSSCLLLHCH